MKEKLLYNTASLCPICLKKLSAEVFSWEDSIYLRKECPEHGIFSIKIWQGESSFHSWTEQGSFVQSTLWEKMSAQGCPYDCGICSQHLQDACCVLLEITNRCNQKCPYCYADGGNALNKDLDLQEIEEIYNFLYNRSLERPYNLQISGGEPTIHNDLPQIIKMGKEKGFPYIQLNTNGKVLADDPKYAFILKKSGLDTVFLQFDGLNDQIYLQLRGEKLCDIKQKAIENCIAADLSLVLVMTLVPNINLDQLGSVLDFLLRRLPHIRGLHLQPISHFGRYPLEDAPQNLTLQDVFRQLVKQSGGRFHEEDFSPLASGHPLCSFQGNFLWENGEIRALSGKNDSCCCGNGDIRQARQLLSGQWGNFWQQYRQKQPYCQLGWNDFLQKKALSGFSVSAMAFQDADSLDLHRLSRCRVYIAKKDGLLIPFCAHNLTSYSGESLYKR